MPIILMLLAIAGILILILRKVNRMAFTLADLENAVTAQNTVIDSVATLLNKLTDELAQANAANDAEAIGRIIRELQNNTARMTTAVTANTPGGQAMVTPLPVPADPEPVVAPAPVDNTVQESVLGTATAEEQPAAMLVVPPATTETAPPVDDTQTQA